MKIMCVRCGEKTDHKHLHDSPYGLDGAHMAGTERYTCQKCGYSIHAEEGKAKGLKFVLD